MDFKLIVIFILCAIILALVAAGALFRLRQKKLTERHVTTEQLAGQAAHDYLKRFEVPATTSAVLRTDGKLIVLIETEPHKKLRFSFIIEQPLKDFINKATSMEVSTVYWRFPIARKESNLPEVKYRDAFTPAPVEETFPQPVPQPVPPPAIKPEPAPVLESENGPDTYVDTQDYQIEEVAWENFPEPIPAEAVPSTEKLAAKDT